MAAGVTAGGNGGGTLDFPTERLTLWCGIDILHGSWSRWGCSGKGGNFSDYRGVSVPNWFGTDNCCDGVGFVAGSFRQAGLARRL